MWADFIPKYIQQLFENSSSGSSTADTVSPYQPSPKVSHGWRRSSSPHTKSRGEGHDSSSVPASPEPRKASNVTVMHNDSHTCQSAVHANVNEKMPREFFDWETSKVTWWRTQVLGRGKYSNVYAVVRKTDGREYAVKSLKPRRAKKFKREILILRNLRAGPNIIEFYGAFVDAYTNEPALIFRKIDNTDWKELYPTLNCEDIRFYSFQLLRALDFAHSKGIMHRDVKPQNVVIDHKARELRLIDWGLADFYFPGAEYSLRVASRFYKPPEILLGNRRYDYSFDMWGTGCLLAAMIFSVEVMFRGDSEEDQLRAISSVLGGADLRAYARDYQIELTPEIIEVVGESRTKRIDLQSFGSRCTSTVGEREAIDVIEKLLRYDPCERLTARQALHHPYYTGLIQGIQDPQLASSAET